MTRFGSKNADLAYMVLCDGHKHDSYEFNEKVGWDWRKAISLVKKSGEKTGEFTIASENFKKFDTGTTVKRYWLLAKGQTHSFSSIVEELVRLKVEHGLDSDGKLVYVDPNFRGQRKLL